MDGREEGAAKNSRSGDVFAGFAKVDLGWGRENAEWSTSETTRSSEEPSFSCPVHPIAIPNEYYFWRRTVTQCLFCLFVYHGTPKFATHVQS
jgi:hypothetical protein